MYHRTKGVLMELLLTLIILTGLAFAGLVFIGLMVYGAAVRLWGSIREHIGD